MKPPSLFIWRSEEQTSYSKGYPPLPFSGTSRACPYCASQYEYRIIDERRIHRAHSSAAHVFHNNSYGPSAECPQCGFWYEKYSELSMDYMRPINQYFLHYSILRKFEINDPLLGMDELGSHLKRKRSDIFFLDPRRFEMLVADIYRRQGYHARLTQQSRDGGYDVILFEKDGLGDQILVECKRFAKGRRVSVDVVRQLLGVQLIRGVMRGRIVTNTSFTTDAYREAAIVGTGESGYEIELVDMDRLCRALGVYNTALPPLHLALPPTPGKLASST